MEENEFDIHLEDDAAEEEAYFPEKSRKWIYFAIGSLAFVLLVLVFLLLSGRKSDAPTVSHIPDESYIAPVSAPDPVSEALLSEEEPVMKEVSEEETFRHGWIINDFGYTYLYGDLAVEQFNYSDKTFLQFVNCVKAISDLSPSGTSVFCMPVPTRIGFLYPEIGNDIKKQDDFYNSSQSAFLDSLEEALPDSVTTVNLYPPFSEAYQTGTDLFFRTDRNWTSDAAFLAYKAFCKASGNPQTSLEVYEREVIPGFLGSFYTATEAEALLESPDDFILYHNEDTDACTVALHDGIYVNKNLSLCAGGSSDLTALYNAYLGTDGGYFVINSPGHSEKKLLLLGDRSCEALLPFLIQNYSEVHYVNVTKFQDDLQTIIYKNQFKDILIVSYLTNAVKGDFPVMLETVAGVQHG